ncbi:MAG: type II toxin-antitoxin system mRNA interferase toxin, RelE/StbE family [Candidatus Absconditabacterales bacterium]|jgi:addiction module RelE/StbE family toxin
MKINNIHYGKHFVKQFELLPKYIQIKSLEKLEIFVKNPLHNSLRLHKLQGRLDGMRSISIDREYRIIFQPQDNDDVLLISIGTHSIYEK